MCSIKRGKVPTLKKNLHKRSAEAFFSEQVLTDIFFRNTLFSLLFGDLHYKYTALKCAEKKQTATETL